MPMLLVLVFWYLGVVSAHYTEVAIRVLPSRDRRRVALTMAASLWALFSIVEWAAVTYFLLEGPVGVVVALVPLVTVAIYDPIKEVI